MLYLNFLFSIVFPFQWAQNFTKFVLLCFILFVIAFCFPPPPLPRQQFEAKLLFQSAPAAYVGFLQQDIHHLAIPATPQSTSSEKGDAEYSPRFSRADQLFEVEKYMKYLITKV